MSSISDKLSPKWEHISNHKVSLAMKFRSLRQTKNESIPDFMTRISEFASKCNFRRARKTLIRDQFIWGLKSKKIRTTLSTQDDIKSPITALRRAVTLKTKDKNNESRSPVKFHIMIGRHTMSSPSNQQKVVHTLIILDSILNITTLDNVLKNFKIFCSLQRQTKS